MTSRDRAPVTANMVFIALGVLIFVGLFAAGVWCIAQAVLS